MRRAASMPDFPWRLARYPELFQHRLVAQRIHRVPEAAVLEGHHLPHGGETDDGRAFPGTVIALNQVEAARRQHEVAAVDEAAVAARLLDEGGDRVAVAFQRAVAPRRAHRGDGGELAVAEVEVDRRADVEIADAVAVSEAEGLIVLDVVGDALETPAGLRALAGVDQRHAPGLGLALMDDDAVVRHVEGDVRHVQEVVGEIFLDDVALVAAADHEVVGAVRRIDLHDVPKDRLAADLDHGLGPQVAFFRNAGSQAARQNDDFHVALAMNRLAENAIATPRHRAGALAAAGARA